MKFRAIHTFGEVFNGKTPSKSEQRSTGLPILKIRDIDGNGKFRGHFESYVEQEFYNKHSKKQLHTGDTVILNAAHNSDYVGSKNAFITDELDGVIATGEWLIVRPKDANHLYVNHFLKSPACRIMLKARVKGIHLYPKDVEKIKIPLPPPDDQIRIAYLLNKVERLIAQRKQNLQQLDDLLKSIFLEMFGPTASGFEKWSLVEIKDLAAKNKGAMRTGPFGSNLLHSEFVKNGDVAVLGIDNAVKNRFVWDERRYITNEKYKELENYRIFPKDVIITIMGTVGRSAVIPDDIPVAINTKHLAAITLNRKVANPLFLSYSVHSSPYLIDQFKRKNRGAIMDGLNLTIIKQTKIRRPPIELQNEFSSIHLRVDGIKTRYQQSLTGLETLYGALSQKAFKGELDLSRVPILSDQEDFEEDEKHQKEQSTPIISTEAMLPKIELPDPDDLKIITSREGRKALIAHWLDVCLDQLGGKTFSAIQFIEATNHKLLELTEELEVPPFGVTDYDQLKQWLFEVINEGKIAQTQDIISEPGEEVVYGNQIVLKVRN